MLEPTLLMLYAITIQLSVYMNIKQIAYLWFAAAKSPKPTVNIMLVAQ